ncbi:Fis family transcriptional regulator [Acetobacter orientalis]|uniref:Fis family transcriptional regulator n=1 Tax=Acetobacter orientalis TaxID=146474 RepID=A0A2Z5ZIL3_9PROT|nr:Fis family transcriptional regulator [Acetobacter orientalis]
MCDTSKKGGTGNGAAFFVQNAAPVPPKCDPAPATLGLCHALRNESIKLHGSAFNFGVGKRRYST